MILGDITSAALVYGTRFVAWIAWIASAEATLAPDGTILMENDGDGAGMTFCGLTQRDDGLTSPTAAWIASTYRKSYWNAVSAPSLPYGVAEETAAIAVNEGVSTAGRILQQALGTVVDGKIGPTTIDAALHCDPHVLCLRLGQYNDEHYKAIAATHPIDLRFLRGWLNRDASMVRTFA